ncbi:hypothetical protein [Nitrosomonas sp.]|uniref:hypothetical protein n=1 Tax=Nitrosomonas sp. TaxID=42353 RepID=UPI0020882996|nr:hypothetical protein [Nitrosomonas sp.]GJL75947.1 MAG: hypothetical protein NMNS02_20530 [Nitrosomonas sp.]
MKQIRDFSDKRLKGYCIHCGEWINNIESNQDHIPTKGLLDEPYPENLPTLKICQRCNSSFSKDEEYLIAFLGTVLSGDTKPDKQIFGSARRILQHNEKLRKRINCARSEVSRNNGEKLLVWEPEHDRIASVILKNARGHLFYELNDIMIEKPSSVWVKPLSIMTTEDSKIFFDHEIVDGWPEVGSRMMSRIISGDDIDGQWIIVQKEVYMYAIIHSSEVVIVKSIIRNYLATEVIWDISE